MLLQTNSYIVPKERRAEHARLLRRFRQILLRLGCDDFEVFEQMGPNWKAADATGRFVQLMRFRDRKHQRQVHAAEQSDPQAQQLINEFCDLINLPYQQQQGLLAIGYYQSVVEVPNVSGKNRGGAAYAEEEAEEELPMGFGGFGLTGAPAAMHPTPLEEEAEAPHEAAAEDAFEQEAAFEEPVPEEAVADEPVAEDVAEEPLTEQQPVEEPPAAEHAAEVATLGEQPFEGQPAEEMAELEPDPFAATAEPSAPATAATTAAPEAHDSGFAEAMGSEPPPELAPFEPLDLDLDAIAAEELAPQAEHETAEPAGEVAHEEWTIAEPAEEIAPEPALEAHLPPVADTAQPAVVEPPPLESIAAEEPVVTEQPIAAEEPVAAEEPILAAEQDLEPPSLEDFLLAEPSPVQEDAPAAAFEPHVAEPEPASMEAEHPPIEAEASATEHEPVAAEHEPVAAEHEPVAAEQQEVPLELEPLPLEAELTPAETEAHEAAPIAELESPEPQEAEPQSAESPALSHADTELPHAEAISPLDLAHGLSDLDLDALHPSEIAPMDAMGHHAPPAIAEAPAAESQEEAAPAAEFEPFAHEPELVAEQPDAIAEQLEPVASQEQPASPEPAVEDIFAAEPEPVAAETAEPVAAATDTGIAAAAPATNGKETWHDPSNGLPVHLTAEEADIEIIYEAIPEGAEEPADIRG